MLYPTKPRFFKNRRPVFLKNIDQSSAIRSTWFGFVVEKMKIPFPRTRDFCLHTQQTFGVSFFFCTEQAAALRKIADGLNDTEHEEDDQEDNDEVGPWGWVYTPVAGVFGQLKPFFFSSASALPLLLLAACCCPLSLSPCGGNYHFAVWFQEQSCL